MVHGHQHAEDQAAPDHRGKTQAPRRDVITRLRSWSRQLLAIIVALAALTTLFLRAEGPSHKLVFVTGPLLGIALALGCLFSFPYASIWKVDKDDFDVENGVRTMLISTVGGAFALTALFLSYDSSRAALRSAEASAEQAKAAMMHQAGNRYTEAVSLLGNENPGVRVGGLFALQQLVDDSGFDQRKVYLILTDYIRSRSRWDPKKRPADDEQLDSQQTGLASLSTRANDVQIAFGLLSRKPKDEPPGGPFSADLRDVDLRGAQFGYAQFEGAVFRGSHLDHIDCRTPVKKGNFTDLQRADFRGASLRGAHLERANLSRARFDLPGTDLRDVWLAGANLDGTRFEHANLAGAHLEGADLSKAHIEFAEFRGATWDETTKWPQG